MRTPAAAQGAPSAAPPPAAAALRRLDGTALGTDSADALVRRLVAEHAIAGLQVAVVNGGRLAWSAAYGVRARGDGAGSAPLGPDLPMQRTTTTWAASITKAVFATYVMHLVERGRFDLDTPVARQLPQPLDAYAPYRDKAARLVRDSAWLRVTPRMLLSHTSGLANFAWLEPDSLMRLHDAPGTRYRYSGEGINLVQFLVEQRLGAPLDTLVRAALLDPLGMTRTSLAFRRDFEADIADRFGPDGRFLAKTRRTPARAAGSMTSTAGDLAVFAIALMDGRVLRPATRDAMLAPQVRITARTQFGPGSEADDGEGSAEARRVGLAYGIGWGLLTRTPHGPAFFKEGHGDGAQTYLLCFPRARSCLVLLANSDNGELAFRPLVNALLGTDAVPWTWAGYTPAQIRAAQRRQP
jgi:CubicO group peptidase (beta-lactamase class C family)